MADPGCELRLGLIGWPLGHSVSPLIHREFMRRAGLSGEYIEYPVKPDSLSDRLFGLSQEGIRGLNVTFPHKEAAAVLCQNLAGEAQDLPYAKIEDDQVILERTDEEKQTKSIHGTYKMIIENAVNGVKNMFEKKLELVGVGYRARLEGKTLVMTLGWNHPVKVEPYEDIEIEVPEETKITIRGIDKQKVGEVAAEIRAFYIPEPYKGKGIRYKGEYVRKKAGKTGVK